MSLGYTSLQFCCCCCCCSGQLYCQRPINSRSTTGTFVASLPRLLIDLRYEKLSYFVVEVARTLKGQKGTETICCRSLRGEVYKCRLRLSSLTLKGFLCFLMASPIDKEYHLRPMPNHQTLLVKHVKICLLNKMLDCILPLGKPLFAKHFCF